MPTIRVLKYLFGLTLALAALVWVFSIAPAKRASADRTYTIAIANLMTVPALDEALAGIKDELTNEGFVEGKNAHYIVQNANGQINLAASIANDLASRNPDVIIPLTTPMTQAVIKVAKAPVVFASVTDPVGSHVVRSLTVGERNVTGASDMWPFEAQMKLIREITPKTKRLGVLFNPGESASQYGIKEIHRLAKQLGFTVVEAPVSSTNDMYPAARSLVGRVDAFFLSSDNTVISGMAGALKVAIQNHIPYFVGDSGTVQKGGLAAVSVGYYALGRDTGRLAARMLRGERNIPVVVEQSREIFLNTKSADLMGVKIPNSVLKKAKHVYTTIQ